MVAVQWMDEGVHNRACRQVRSNALPTVTPRYGTAVERSHAVARNNLTYMRVGACARRAPSRQ